MAKRTAVPAALPTLADEWSRARDVIEKADDRIHETRKMVFGLFATLLAAGSVIGKDRSTDPWLWLGVHLALLGLLLAGRFVEQQAFLLQAVAASRAWVVELLAPVELTGTLCDRFVSMGTGGRGFWPARTTYVYECLGVVSGVVTGLIALSSPTGADRDRFALWFAAATVAYGVAVCAIGKQEIRFARDGLDWSLSATSTGVGEPVHILLVNQKDGSRDVQSSPAKLVRLVPLGDATDAGDVVQLERPAALIGPDGKLRPRGVLHWVWTPERAGLWVLKVQVRGPEGEAQEVFLRRFVHVAPAAAPVDRRPELEPGELQLRAEELEGVG